MTVRELKADIERQQQFILDEEWLLEQTLAAHEGEELTEAYEERTRLDAIADEEVRRLLDTLPLGSLATRRLDYLLSVAHMYRIIWTQRRTLSRYLHDLAALEDA